MGLAATSPGANKQSQLEALRGLLRRYERQAGIGVPPQGISTGVAALDERLGGGGWERGQIVEIAGPVGGGRLSLALHSAAAAGRAGHWVALVDGEGAFYPPGAAQFGVLLPRLCVIRPPRGQRVGWAAEQLARSGRFALVILVPSAPVSEAQGRRIRQAAEAGRAAVLVVDPKGSTLPSNLRLAVSPWRPPPAARDHIARLAPKGAGSHTPQESAWQESERVGLFRAVSALPPVEIEVLRHRSALVGQRIVAQLGISGALIGTG